MVGCCGGVGGEDGGGEGGVDLGARPINNKKCGCLGKGGGGTGCVCCWGRGGSGEAVWRGEYDGEEEKV